MAFPTVVQETSGEQASDSATHVINVPTATLDNAIVCFFGVDCQTADSQYVTISIAVGVGWELIRQDGNGNFNCASALLVKRVAAGNATDALTLTTTGITATQQSTHICVELSGADDFAVSFIGSTGGTNPNPAAVTGADGTQDYLIYVYRAGDNTVVPSVAPTNYGNLLNKAATNAAGCSSSVMRRALNGTGDDPGTMTCATEQWCVYTVAFSPLVDEYAVVAQTITIPNQAIAGSETFTGTVAQTITIASQAIAGSETFTGTIVQTITHAGQVISGSEIFTGTVAQTITIPNQAIAGSEIFTGTIAQAISPAGEAASGSETLTGAIAQVISPATQDVAGETHEITTGTISQTSPFPAQEATGLSIDGAPDQGSGYAPGMGDGVLAEPVTMQFRAGKFQEVDKSEFRGEAESQREKSVSKDEIPNTSLADKYRALSEIPFESLTQPKVKEIEEQLDPMGLAPFFPNQDPEIIVQLKPVHIPVPPPLPPGFDYQAFNQVMDEDDWLVIYALIENGDI